jgi:hypothetical protein
MNNPISTRALLEYWRDREWSDPTDTIVAGFVRRYERLVADGVEWEEL